MSSEREDDIEASHTPESAGAGLDTSTHEAFLKYYSEQSARPETIAAFQRLVNTVLAALPEGMADRTLKVADVGGGAGTLSRQWANAGHDVTCVDLSADLLDVGRQRAEAEGLEITFRNCSATDLPFEDASFDICILPELLEHIEDWESCVNEAARIVRPGGALFISTTNVLCPKQQEFTLPFYSWYPGFLKRHYERLSVTTQPELANYARYPAVHWFSYYSLAKYLKGRGFDRFLDRADLLAIRNRNGAKAVIANVIRALPPLRFMMQVITPGSIILGFKATREDNG